MSADPLAVIPPDEEDLWTVAGDLREVVNFDNESTNYVVEKLLRAEGVFTDLDSEYSCFYGYTTNEADANSLRNAAMRIASDLVTYLVTPDTTSAVEAETLITKLRERGAVLRFNTRAEALTEAYHTIFDIKDTMVPSDDGWYQTYETLASLARLMKGLGITVPERFDGGGRS